MDTAMNVEVWGRTEVTTDEEVGNILRDDVDNS